MMGTLMTLLSRRTLSRTTRTQSISFQDVYMPHDPEQLSLLSRMDRLIQDFLVASCQHVIYIRAGFLLVINNG